MALLNELLQKQEKRLQGKVTASKERVKIARTGATRPWQEDLPQYQQKAKQRPAKGKDTRDTGDSVLVYNKPDDCPATGDNNGGQQPINRGQKPAQQGTTGDNNGGQQPINRGQKPAQQGTAQARPRLTPKLSPVNLTVADDNDMPVPRLGAARPPLQPGTATGTNGGQLPTAPQELALLFCLVEEMRQTGLGTTRVLKNDDLADMAKIKRAGFKKVRARLLTSGHCTRRKVGEGRSRTAGCIYAVSDEAIAAYHTNRGQQSRSTGDNSGPPRDSSSRSLSIETTTTKADDRRLLIERFQLLVDDIGVDDKYQADGTDLLGWWLKVEKEYGMAIDDFEESFERWVFKLNAAPIREGIQPKGVLAGRVLSGPCGRPVGFVSRNDRKAQELAQMRTERLGKARRQMLDTYNDDFEIWFAECDDAALLECVPEEDGQRKSVQPEKPGDKMRRSPMLRGLVRAEYASKQGIDLDHWDHLVDQLG